MKTINSEIKDAARELKNLRATRKGLIESIKNNIFGYNSKYDTTPGRKDKITAALYFFFKKKLYSCIDNYFCPYLDDRFNVYFSHIDLYKSFGGTSPIKVAELKYVLNILDYRFMWRTAVDKNRYEKSLEEYEKTVRSLKGLALFSVIQSVYQNRFHVISCKELQFKNIFILLPE